MFFSSSLFSTEGFTPYSINLTFVSKVLKVFLTLFHTACGTIISRAGANLAIDGHGDTIGSKVVVLDVPATNEGWVLYDPPLTRMLSTSVKQIALILVYWFRRASTINAFPCFAYFDMGFATS